MSQPVRNCRLSHMSKNIFACLLLTLLLTGCSSQREISSANPEQANEVMFTAMQQVGKPYRYGGSSPNSGFDCSGLVNYVYRQSVGIKLPRTVRELNDLDSPQIDKSNLESGDLVIFATGWSKKADHAGIYVGKGRFVHAPSSGGKVRLDKMDDKYWQRSFITGKRPLASH